MAVNNVFQMLAQQEIDRPARKLQDLQVQQQEMQLKRLQDEQAYQEGARNAMKGPSLANLGPMAGEYQPVQTSSLTQAMQPQQQAAPAIVDQFKRQYDYHVANGRPDLAQGVMDHQIDLSMKAAKVAEHVYKAGGKEGLAAWLQASPTFAPLLGDPAKMHVTKDGVLFPATDDKGQPVPGMYWHRDENDRPVFKEIKPIKPEVGKPFAREYEEGDTKVTELYDASGKLTGTKRAPRYKPESPAGDKTDSIVAREVVKDLPKLRREARTAEASKPRLAQMISLLDSGAGGLKGNALAAISGVFDTSATSEAELFKKLAAAGAGQLRTAVIGPGAVSNYEQSLLQAISGGGNGARTATRQLLKFYDQEADRTINNYNDAVDSAVTVAPKAAKGFGKMGAKQSSGGGKGKKPLSAY